MLANPMLSPRSCVALTLLAALGCDKPAEKPAPEAAPAPAEAAKPAAAAEAAKPDAEEIAMRVGAKAAEFAVADDTGTTRKLSDHLGKEPVLLAFYPKNFTPGCTAELTEFRERLEVFTEAGVAVYGVSIDPPDKHAEFRKHLELPFPLLADADGALSKAYSSFAEYQGMPVSARKTILIDREGTIVYRDDAYDPREGAGFTKLQEAVAKLAPAKNAPGEAVAAAPTAELKPAAK